jgi:hypothetical protein
LHEEAFVVGSWRGRGVPGHCVYFRLAGWALSLWMIVE